MINVSDDDNKNQGGVRKTSKDCRSDGVTLKISSHTGIKQSSYMVEARADQRAEHD